MRSSDYGAGTGEYALFNPSNMLDVYNARGDLIGEVSAQKAVSIIDRHGYIKRGHAIYPGDYDATQELLAEMRDLEKMTDQHHAQYDSKPFRRGSGPLPAFGAAQTVPVSDRRARNTTGAPAIQWSESGAAAPTTSTSRPVTRPMGRDAFAPRLNGKEVKWLD